MYEMTLREPETFFLGKESNFNDLDVAHPGIQKVTRLYPINFSSGSQVTKNIRELRVEKHFHFFSEFFVYRDTKLLRRKGGRVEVGGRRSKVRGWRLEVGGQRSEEKSYGKFGPNSYGRPKKTNSVGND